MFKIIEKLEKLAAMIFAWAYKHDPVYGNQLLDKDPSILRLLRRYGIRLTGGDNG